MMRVKNEEKWLEQSLSVTSQIVDHIVILDDGSTDRTKEICQSFEKVTYYYQDKPLDESRDRDQLLKWTLALKPDWILCLDGDEVIEKTAGDRILHEISAIDPQNPQYTSFILHILYFWNGENTYRTENSLYAHFWENRLFTTWGQNVEQLAIFKTDHGGNFHCGSIPGNITGKSKMIDVKIKHFGYVDAPLREKKKAFYTNHDPIQAEKGYYDHLTDETTMELSMWSERSIHSFTSFPKPQSYFNHMRKEIIDQIPLESEMILDVGCAAGGIGKYVKVKNPSCKVYGIEVDELAVINAKQYYDEVFVMNLDHLEDLPIPHYSFDVIICADVLEHLYNPYRVLAILSKYLKEGGTLITSIPNIRHISTVNELLRGNWAYEYAGILDNTHIRFFTLKEMQKMLFDAGYIQRHVTANKDPNFLISNKDGHSLINLDTPDFTLKNLSEQDILEYESVQFILSCQKRPICQTNKKTSIILITYNQLNYTKLCMQSILQFTSEEIELIVVDNGSTDGTIDYLYTLPYVTVVENKENKGFAYACNQGLEVSTGEYVLLLNNDTFVTEAWLTELLYIAESNSTIGLVGPVTNYAGSTQCLPNVNLQSKEEIANYGKVNAMNHWNRSEEATLLSGFCMLIKQEVIQKIGGFDTRFGIGNFEDDDYCLRARLAGFTCHVARGSYVHHFGHMTFKNEKIEYDKVFYENWTKFKQKWQLPEAVQVNQKLQIKELLTNNYSLQDLFVPYRNPLVTVVVTVTEGEEALLQETVQSLSKQVYQRVEVVVINKSNTLKGIERCLDKIPYPTKMISIGNESIWKGLKAAYFLANGDFVTYLIEGDVLYSNHLQNLITKMTTNKDVKVAYTEAYLSDEKATVPPLFCFMHEINCVENLTQRDTEYATNSYVPLLKHLLENYEVKKIAKITGEAGSYPMLSSH